MIPKFAPYKPSADAAKKLLADAGVTSAVPVSITVTNSPAQVRTAEIIQAQANQAGFKVEVKQIDSTSLITVLSQKDFDLCMSPWSRPHRIPTATCSTTSPRPARTISRATRATRSPHLLEQGPLRPPPRPSVPSSTARPQAAIAQDAPMLVPRLPGNLAGLGQVARLGAVPGRHLPPAVSPDLPSAASPCLRHFQASGYRLRVKKMRKTKADISAIQRSANALAAAIGPAVPADLKHESPET